MTDIATVLQVSIPPKKGSSEGVRTFYKELMLPFALQAGMTYRCLLSSTPDSGAEFQVEEVSWLEEGQVLLAELIIHRYGDQVDADEFGDPWKEGEWQLQP